MSVTIFVNRKPRLGSATITILFFNSNYQKANVLATNVNA